MRKTRVKWIKKLFKDKDENLLLSIEEAVGRSKVKRQPFKVAKAMWNRKVKRQPFKVAKAMWNRHDVLTKIWGK